MAKINLSNVLTLLGINSNFQKVKDELNNKVLYRDNPVGEPNTMETPLDMNGEKILNLPQPTSNNEPVRLADVNNGLVQNINIGNLTDAGALTGSEQVPVSRGNGGPLKTTLTAIAQWVLQTYQGFTQSGAGVVARTAQDKLRESVSVADYGAKGDWNGTSGTDDTVAIQAAINAAAGGRIYLPPGRYRITAALVINSATTTLEGAGMQATEIVNTTNNTGILRFTGQWGGFRQLSMSYSGTPVSGATAVYSTSANLIGEAFHIKSCHRGLEVTTGPAQLFENFFIDNYVEIGIFVHEDNDCYFTNFILDAKNATNGSLGGIRLFDKAEAMIFSNGSVLNGKYPITTDAAVYAQGVRPAYCKFSDVFFDSGAQEAFLDKFVESGFTNVWFSGGRTGAGFPGVKLLQTDSISFNGGSNFFNCGGHGLHISSASARTVVDSCCADSNSISAGAGVAHGIYVEPGTSDFILKGNICRNGLYPGGQQGYGIYIDAGVSARYLVKDNNLAGNATGAMVDGGTGALSRVADNIGYNPIGLFTIAVGASPFSYFSGNTRETVYITGGTVTAVQSGATVLFTGSEKAIAMEPGESVIIYYSSAPTMQRYRH